MIGIHHECSNGGDVSPNKWLSFDCSHTAPSKYVYLFQERKERLRIFEVSIGNVHMSLSLSLSLCNLLMTPHVRLLAGRSTGLSSKFPKKGRELTLPCSYRNTCSNLSSVSAHNELVGANGKGCIAPVKVGGNIYRDCQQNQVNTRSRSRLRSAAT